MKISTKLKLQDYHLFTIQAVSDVSSEPSAQLLDCFQHKEVVESQHFFSTCQGLDLFKNSYCSETRGVVSLLLPVNLQSEGLPLITSSAQSRHEESNHVFITAPLIETRTGPVAQVSF